MTCSSSKALAGVNPPAIGNSNNSPPKPPPQRRTFYRRTLPESCVALSSPEGQSRFSSAMATQGTKSFFPLIEQFTTQSEPAFCGISTLVIVLNTLAIDPRRAWKGPWRWYEESMLNCCLDPETIKQTGITINDFRCLAICQGLAVKAVLVDDLLGSMNTINGTTGDGGRDEEDNKNKSNDKAIDEFRQAVKQACTATDNANSATKDEYLVVSYSRKVLGQTGSGHFSPIAAYDEASDSVLILDTARFKYGAHWASLPLVFQAMIPKDPDTGKSRGYILLSDTDHEEGSTTRSSDQPSLVLPSVLFRSQRKQNPVRRKYKDFLSDKRDPSFDDVAVFWTKDGNNPSYIWKMLDVSTSNNGNRVCVYFSSIVSHTMISCSILAPVYAVRGRQRSQRND